MQKSTFIWLCIVVIGLVLTIVIGYSYVYVSKEDKKRVRKFRKRRDELRKISIKRPAVAIRERAPFMIIDMYCPVTYVFITASIVFALMAWLWAFLNCPFGGLRIPYGWDVDVRLAHLFLTLSSIIIHIIIGVVFYAVGISVALMRRKALKEYYKDCMIMDLTSLEYLNWSRGGPGKPRF